MRMTQREALESIESEAPDMVLGPLAVMRTQESNYFLVWGTEDHTIFEAYRPVLPLHHPGPHSSFERRQFMLVMDNNQAWLWVYSLRSWEAFESRNEHRQGFYVDATSQTSATVLTISWRTCHPLVKAGTEISLRMSNRELNRLEDQTLEDPSSFLLFLEKQAFRSWGLV